MNSLRRTKSVDVVNKTPLATSTLKQQLFILDSEQRMVIQGTQMREGPVEKKLKDDEKREKLYQYSKHSTIFFNSLGSVKILEMVFASSVVACLWSNCRFTYYMSGYCYGPASAFQLQNYPIFISLLSILVNMVVLLMWLATWEQRAPHDCDNKWKRKKVAQADTIFALFFVLINIGALIVETWMIIKYNQGYSCPMCNTLALWVVAAAFLTINTVLYVYNIFLCLHQRRLNTIIHRRL